MDIQTQQNTVETVYILRTLEVLDKFGEVGSGDMVNSITLLVGMY